MSDTRVRGLTLAVVAALGFYCLARLDLTNSILHFLPSGKGAELVELSLELVDSPLSRRMVLAVGGGAREERHGAAEQLADSLRSHPEVAWVETGFGEDALRSVYELYFERRFYLASDEPAVEVPRMIETDALERRAERLKRELAGPAGMLAARTAASDPLGLFDLVLERMRAAGPAYSTEGGGLASPDGSHALVLLGLRSSPFDSERQGDLLRHVETEFARIAAAAGGSLEIEQSGVNRIAVASEQSVRGDVGFISMVSISGVCVLFLLVFRSLRHLLTAILVPLTGFAAATAVALTVSAPIHGITLAFGFVLLGVAIDYPIHLMNHHALGPTGTPRASVARIRASLLLSALTTTLAFTALALSEFPGLGEMGSFAAIGVPVAIVLTTLALPAFLPADASPTRVQLGVSRGAVRLIRWLGERPRLASGVLVAFTAIAAVGMPLLVWDDDPGSLMAADPALLAEDTRVREHVADVDGRRFVVGLAPDRESALALNDRIHHRLEGAVAAGHLEGMRSLHAVLWSEGLQRENLAAFRSAKGLDDRIDRAFTARGFQPGAFRGFAAAVASPASPPLLPEDLAGSPLERALDSMAELDGRFAVVTYVRGVRSGEALRDALADLDGAWFVDQQEIVGQVYAGYRRSTLQMVALGSAVVFLVLQLRYRNVRRGLLAFAPSALVACTTLGLFGIFGVSVNVVAAISLVVVLGMGVDYGIFIVDGARDVERLGPTMTSLLVSCLTTLFVFGTLALSGQPVLRAIGLTTGLGILLALLLSPAVFVLAQRGEAS